MSQTTRQWEERYKELKVEKHGLMQQYEEIENKELNEIRDLRREAATLRVKLADQGDANDDLYTNMVTINRQGEGINKDHYQLKEQLHEHEREVAKNENELESLKHQVAQLHKEGDLMNKER